MEYSDTSAKRSTLYQPYLVHLMTPSLFFLHAVGFVGAALIGIARYGYAAPAALIVFMTVWSIALLLHGVFRWRKESIAEKTRDGVGVLRTVFFASILNVMMWVMWTLATDAQSSAPFHLTIWIALLASSISALVVGKRTLYAHWQRQFLRDQPLYDQDMKAKRGEHSLADVLDEDGELTDYADQASHRLEER